MIIVKKCFEKLQKMILLNLRINIKVKKYHYNHFYHFYITGSDEEKTDLKGIYLDVTGDMDQIFERHLLTCLEDEDRLRSMIDQMIEDNEVPAFDAYTKETKAKRNKRHKKVTIRLFII
jgi:hypothetical protein